MQPQKVRMKKLDIASPQISSLLAFELRIASSHSKRPTRLQYATQRTESCFDRGCNPRRVGIATAARSIEKWGAPPASALCAFDPFDIAISARDRILKKSRNFKAG